MLDNLASISKKLQTDPLPLGKPPISRPAILDAVPPLLVLCACQSPHDKWALSLVPDSISGKQKQSKQAVPTLGRITWKPSDWHSAYT